MGLSIAVVSFGCDSTPACGDSCDCAGDDLAAECGPSHCSSGSADGDESDLDCGGSCSGCADGAACRSAADCASSVCSEAGACVASSCEDGVQNGDELGLDCGGACNACPAECDETSDCAEGECVDGACVPRDGSGGAGGDGGQGGTETGTGGVSIAGAAGEGGSSGDGSTGGTGGSSPTGGTGGAPPACTSDCPTGAACSGPEICASGVCTTGGACAAPACGDGVQNGAETALDCGGGCTGCARGADCAIDSDCASVHCKGLHCVVGPTAGFSIAQTPGVSTFFVQATSSASALDGDIDDVEYDFGDGGGFDTPTSHNYVSSGTFTIVQRVTDEYGLANTASRSVTVNLSGFSPVVLNEEDREDEVVLTTDRLGMEVIDDGAFVGVRSTRAVTPGSGMFYFEGQRITDQENDMYFGVAPASLSRREEPGLSAGDHGLGVDISGSVRFNATSVGDFDSDNEFYGVVLDYRTTTPVAYVIVDDDVISSTTMTGVTEPLFIFVGGRRREVGEQARINAGNDTENFPFEYDAEQALNVAGVSNASQLVLGWGQTHAEPASARPSLSVSGTTNIALGASTTLTATVSDAEDATAALAVHWIDLATTHAEPDDNDGTSWNFTPRAIGIHPIQVTVTDTSGLTRTSIVDVNVSGTLPQFNPVQLVEDDLTGRGIDVSGSGLAAKWGSNGKYGIRANQGMIGDFMYFEMHRLIAPTNQGGGLVILEGDLDPYSPINIPPSCSVNHSASIWRNLISEGDYDTEATEYYGFAVDYRGRHPIVYVITTLGGATPLDLLTHEMELDDVTVPIYPMLYGNPTGEGAAFDAEINFGATPFHYNPVTVLQNGGVGTAGLVVGWGDANR